jgi:hypothetical protein
VVPQQPPVQARQLAPIAPPPARGLDRGCQLARITPPPASCSSARNRQVLVWYRHQAPTDRTVADELRLDRGRQVPVMVSYRSRRPRSRVSSA